MKKIDIQNYLNPKSVMTMGGSAAMVITFTTILSISFNLPDAPIALLLSFLFKKSF